ncbi:hypothetical protein LTR91_005750 [Friedmanniomyces endolithicus]|uniref:DUF4267 domain-containing protein n=1 Tax=Friedmanniomyces endolithicus TaxID=329885 RepID=A0A4U0VLV5_9PEZI|nr:hypothetical protein LTS09_013752 [Friedmanniomyces endolithicus]KAK0274706.1 hypothetical protein LTR35_011488 [Friedmanniomyces endolithicus]KAK0288406.1 hypothetical protein LTS00_009617 [Friedmanniomyces endolithicus]KAK0307942.1 hypothetical protein LTR01_005274 [Friedmanniomyces endolithicus]KAK0317871.1 hypothetical protein LTR82_011132 [Friedmanniomyces endolithicus]
MPPTPAKRLFAYTIPAFLLLTGAVALLSPTTLASAFGMPIPAHSHAAGFVQCIGGRNLTFGLISAVFAAREDLRALGTMAGFLALDGAVDGWVCWKYAGLMAAAPHWVAAVGVPFVGMWLAG